LKAVSRVIPSFIDIASQNFERLGQILSEQSHDEVSRDSFLKHIAEYWNLQTIANIGAESMEYLVTEFNRGNIAPPIPSSLQAYEKHGMGRSFSQSTANDSDEGDDSTRSKAVSPIASLESSTSHVDLLTLSSNVITSTVQPEGLRIIDATEAVANTAYHFSDIAFVYPVIEEESKSISQTMTALAKEHVPNLHGSVPKVIDVVAQVGSGQSIMGALRGGSASNAFLSSAALGHLIPSMFGFQRDGFFPVFHVAVRNH
jgi:hypothetical protein